MRHSEHIKWLFLDLFHVVQMRLINTEFPYGDTEQPVSITPS